MSGNCWFMAEKRQQKRLPQKHLQQCPAYKKHEFKKHKDLTFKIIPPLIRNWCRSEKDLFLIQKICVHWKFEKEDRCSFEVESACTYSNENKKFIYK